MALLPLGINLPSGVSVRIDQGSPFKFIVKTCLQQGCIASFVVGKVFIQSLQRGDKLNINFTGNDGNPPITISGSLKGIADGIEATNL